jgi:DNA-directed RNA polymerase subunit RPC12/RpoP
MKCTCPNCGKKIVIAGSKQDLKEPYFCPECSKPFVVTDDGKYLLGIQDYIVGFFKAACINITAEQALKCYFA